MAMVSITIPDALQAVLTEATLRYGPAVLDIMVTDWLRSRNRIMDDDDVAQVRAGTASPQTKARVRATLGL